MMQPPNHLTHMYSLPPYKLLGVKLRPFQHVLQPVEFKGTKIYPSKRNEKFVFSQFNLQRMMRGQSPYTCEGEDNIRQLGLNAFNIPEAAERFMEDEHEAAVMAKGIQLYHKQFPEDYRNFYKMHLHHLTLKEGGPLVELDAQRHISAYSDVIHGFANTESDVERFKGLKARVKQLEKVKRNPRIRMPYLDEYTLFRAKETMQQFKGWQMNRSSHNMLRKAWWKARAIDFIAYANNIPSPVEFKSIEKNR